MIFQRPVENILAVASYPEVFSIEFKPDGNNVRLTLTGDRCYSGQRLRLQVLSFSFREHRPALLHSHQTARESHLGIGRWNSHVRYDVPENIGLPRQVFLFEQGSQRSIHLLESVEMLLSS